MASDRRPFRALALLACASLGVAPAGVSSKALDAAPPRSPTDVFAADDMRTTPLTLAAAAQSAPASPATAPKTAPASASERYLIQVLVPQAALHETPDPDSPVIGRVEQGAQLEADARSGEWYRVRRVGAEPAWILNAPVPTGSALAVSPFPANLRLGVEAAGQDPRAPQSLTPEERAAAEKSAENGIQRRRPQGQRLEPRLPLIDPSQVSPPTPFALREEMPVIDRWRIVKGLGLMPYDLRDPYNPNVLKGDLPILQKQLGNDVFFNLSAVSDSVVELRSLPTPVGAQSTQRANSNGPFGRNRQGTFSETAIIGLSLIKGNTVFRPPDYELRFVPVFNINHTITEEFRAVNINPQKGETRTDGYVGVQEFFFDKHLRDVSTRYDFDSVRVGIQPFTSDFRGFLFLDQPLGLRLFGTRDNNQWQYNVGAFRRLEKDTNSGLNDVKQRPRADDVYVANLYRQDFLVPGFTLQGTAIHNRNREGSRGQYYNENGFLERPAVVGTGRPHNYDVTYLGLNGDGHFGRWNITASGYVALGKDTRGMISNRREDIRAYFGAAEVSRDFDWVRVRGTALFQSGDKNPFDNKATGFDAIVENPLIAGADTSYWIRQSIPFIGGGGTALSIRNGVLASLRTSREHGQSNFTNPGLHLFGIGADFDVRPQFRIITNLNYLEFDNLSSLAALRNQRLTSTRIGYDLSAGIQYRPLFNQNVVINASAGALFPLNGLRQLFGDAVDRPAYSVLVNILLAY
jgi:hypothetical protein